MLEVVLKLDLHNDKEMEKAMRIVSGFAGVGSLDIGTKDKKLTVAGDMDPVRLVNKLGKLFHTDIVSIRPAKRDDPPPPLYNYGRYVTV